MAKRNTNKTSSRIGISKMDSYIPSMAERQPLSGYSNPLFSKRNLLIIAVLILALLLFKFKNLFVVASVNGKLISRWQLEKELNSKYAAQTLDNLISEQIILSQASQKGISVSSSDIDTNIKQIESRLKGKMSLNNALAAQGMTLDSFRKQVEIQLTIDKMFDKDASVSDKEIDEFITQNKSTLPVSTDPAQLRAQVLTNLRQQKVGDLFDKWFADAKQKAKVVKY